MLKHKQAARYTVQDLINFQGGPVYMELGSKDSNHFLILRTEDQFIGEIYFSPHMNTDLYCVRSSRALSGYGPLLYDWAMEKATQLGGYLCCDRLRQFSLSAEMLWLKYLTARADVIEKPTIDFRSPELFLKSLRFGGRFDSFYSLSHHKKISYFISAFPTITEAICNGHVDIRDSVFQAEWRRLTLPIYRRDYLIDEVLNKGVCYAFRKENPTTIAELNQAFEKGRILNGEEL